MSDNKKRSLRESVRARKTAASQPPTPEASIPPPGGPPASGKPGATASGQPAPTTEPPLPLRIVCLAASAGGLDAFSRLLSVLSADLNLSIVLIQHLDPTHRSLLPELVARSTALPVSEIVAGEMPRAGHVHVLPANTVASLSGGAFVLTPRLKGQGLNMPADLFLRSLAAETKSSAVGVVLSGSGSDGSLGLKEVKAEGGLTFAQDPRTSDYPLMPRSAIATGCVDFVLSPEEIGAELDRIGRPDYAAAATLPGAAIGTDQELARIFKLLHSGAGIDFTHYKKNTLRRRILRRMMLRRIDSMHDYLEYLGEHPAEVQDLCQDMLIKVTSFFRDPDAFAALKTHVFPVIMHKRPPDAPVRIWVPGCSTGEEVYSLVISLLEFLGTASVGQAIQVFGTDVSDAAIQKARAGSYIENISLDVSPGRLRRFFIRTEGGYQVNKSIRDLCIFARQNATNDPPFSRLDIISCRNLMIYLEPGLQRRMLHTFHYALKPTGFLTLGTSENIGALSDLFGVVDKTHKFFCKKSAPGKLAAFHLTAGDLPTERLGLVDRASKGTRDIWSADDVRREADRIVLSSYAPAGVVIDDDMQILQFRGKTGPYLEPAPGDATLSLLKMARDGLALDLRTAIHKSRKSGDVVRKEGVAVRTGAGIAQVDVEVWPLKAPLPHGRCFLVIFSSSQAPRPPSESPPGKVTKGGRAARSGEAELALLRRELSTAKEYLQSIVEEPEATNEELKSANEEILSSNEELHSINEELETAKEELQSTNEELTTVNEELQSRNVELGLANDDLRNLLTSVNIPILMLGADLRIRRITPSAERLLGLSAIDIGRPLAETRPSVTGVDIDPIVAEVLDTMSTIEQQVQDAEGRWYVMRVRPYRTLENKIDGAVICWLEIDAMKRGELALTLAHDRMSASASLHRSLFDHAAEGLLLLDTASGSILDANAAAAALLGRARDQLLARLPWQVGLFGDRPTFEAALHGLRAGPTLRVDAAVDGAGRTRALEIVSTVHEAGEATVLRCVLRPAH